MLDTFDLQKELGNEIDKKNIENLITSVKAAILDPEEKIRQNIIEDLNKKLKNTLQRGYAADNQLFIILKDPQFPPFTVYVCDMPKTYIGIPSKPQRFYRTNKDDFKNPK